MLEGNEIKNKALDEYFFSGGLEYEPQTISAENREDAEKIWEETKKKVDKNLEANNSNQ